MRILLLLALGCSAAPGEPTELQPLGGDGGASVAGTAGSPAPSAGTGGELGGQPSGGGGLEAGGAGRGGQAGTPAQGGGGAAATTGGTPAGGQGGTPSAGAGPTGGTPAQGGGGAAAGGTGGAPAPACPADFYCHELGPDAFAKCETRPAPDDPAWPTCEITIGACWYPKDAPEACLAECWKTYRSCD